MDRKDDLGALPSWDLSTFFNGRDDPRISAVLADSKNRAEIFAQRWRGGITDAASVEDILMALQEYEAMLQEALKPYCYADLLHATDAENSDHGALVQNIQAALTDIENKLLFLKLELIGLSDETLQRLIDGDALKNYTHYLEKLLRTKPHRLIEREEQMMNDFSLTGASAFTRLFDEELSRKKFRVVIEDETHEWPEEKVLNLLYNADREKRKAGADAMTKGLQEDLWRLTYIFNTLAEDNRISDRYQKYATPEAARHLENEITQEVVDTMSAAVSESIGVVADYYNVKRAVLGLPELYDYDRYAPVLVSEKIYSFDEAREIVLSAYGKFSPVMREKGNEFFEKRWIDAQTRHGKRGGAFCSYMTPDTHPVVFLNYLGAIKHVLTLAHELGHGVHASLMRKHTLLNFDTSLTIAETASVFGEMLVFDSLRKTLEGKERTALYMGRIEDMFATVFRQHALYKFEQDFHAARRSEGELKPERIGELWMSHQKAMFGDSVTLRDDYSIWWSYITHFLHTPFYVYAYTFGELLTLSLYDTYLKTDDKAAFADTYIAMLETGGTKSPQELVDPFGVDLSSKEFWQGGIRVIQTFVEETKKLVEEAKNLQ